MMIPKTENQLKRGKLFYEYPLEIKFSIETSQM